jgi:ankyrin repeat protein
MIRWWHDLRESQVEMDSPADNSAAARAINAIHQGNLALLEQLLSQNPGLATARVDGKRTLLHVATDWPGHYPNSDASVATLIAHGAEVNAQFIGDHAETALHWAASSDDVRALDALLDNGAETEARGGVIGGGTPLDDAVAFGQWEAARRLVERGARTTLWQAAALGLMTRVGKIFASESPPSPDEITNAFWSACHGGQTTAAEYLLRRGADLNWVEYDGLTPLDAAARSGARELVGWLRDRGARSGKKLE